MSVYRIFSVTRRVFFPSNTIPKSGSIFFFFFFFLGGGGVRGRVVLEARRIFFANETFFPPNKIPKNLDLTYKKGLDFFRFF